MALTLRSLCGLSTDEIARAFLVEPVTMAQRLVRAKSKIKLAKIPYAVPERAELGERLDAVLTVVYLVFSEGYAATSGDSWIRRDLSSEAIRLWATLGAATAGTQRAGRARRPDAASRRPPRRSRRRAR